MIRRPPRSTRTDTLFPYTTLFRSIVADRVPARIAERRLAVRGGRAPPDMEDLLAGVAGQVIAHPLLQIPPPPILGLRPHDELVPFVALRLRIIVARGQLGQHVAAIVRLQLDTRTRVTGRPDDTQHAVPAIDQHSIRFRLRQPDSAPTL